ncbi:protein BOLA4, chloroplastic/mitochondrial-like [Triticum dicoccoides]|uniref:protein BOLA4, chloroplastic/mitochondrial-like n=1 Tax=Triticum dicoccoides TaxID=85692 RepID=UPI0018913525|nr:protein BOLA4, chloroplastic/mitochondrial-like [Triticum dicoccoides]
MLLMRSAAAPCSFTSMLLRRFTTSSSASYAICRQATLALSSLSSSSSSSSSARFTTWSPPPLSGSTRTGGFSAWASAPGPEGPTGSTITLSMETKIKEQLEADIVTVVDASGDGRHVCIDVVSKAFEGKSAVNRQRMVYKVIWEELQSTVHAVDQMTTKTPGEAAGN